MSPADRHEISPLPAGGEERSGPERLVDRSFHPPSCAEPASRRAALCAILRRICGTCCLVQVRRCLSYAFFRRRRSRSSEQPVSCHVHFLFVLDRSDRRRDSAALAGRPPDGHSGDAELLGADVLCRHRPVARRAACGRIRKSPECLGRDSPDSAGGGAVISRIVPCRPGTANRDQSSSWRQQAFQISLHTAARCVVCAPPGERALSGRRSRLLHPIFPRLPSFCGARQHLAERGLVAVLVFERHGTSSFSECYLPIRLPSNW